MVSRSSPDIRMRDGERYWVWVRVVPRGVVTVETMVRSSARAGPGRPATSAATTKAA
jgi:hypothetical protein